MYYVSREIAKGKGRNENKTEFKFFKASVIYCETFQRFVMYVWLFVEAACIE